MAPTADFTAALLGKRDCARDYYGRCYSGWYWYGRWIFAAVVIVIVLAIFLLWTCVNSRRRRKRGMQPMYGTGWMAPAGQYGHYQNNPAGYNTAPPPAYGVSPNQQYPMQPQYTAEGYYGQREGVQQPKTTPNNGMDYAPPEGPPPAKTTH